MAEAPVVPEVVVVVAAEAGAVVVAAVEAGVVVVVGAVVAVEVVVAAWALPPFSALALVSPQARL